MRKNSVALAALRDMARRRPSSPEAFREVSGVGEAKARQYGDAFVAAIIEACESRGVEMNVDPTLKPAPKPERAMAFWANGERLIWTGGYGWRLSHHRVQAMKIKVGWTVA